MTDIKVILSVDAISTSVATDNIAIGTNADVEKVVIDNIVAMVDGTADDTTDDQRAISDLEENMLLGKKKIRINFEGEDDKNMGCNSDNVLRRKRHRRGRSKKRKWKPYNKLTWDEKRQLEDKESLRAHRVRAERFADGKPVAPYNTTQFLMEDHNEQVPNIGDNNREPRQRKESGNGMEEDDYYYSSPEDEEQFLQKEFSQVYQSINAERLSSMNKVELIHEYMVLEDRVEMLEDILKDDKSTADTETKVLQEKIQELEKKIKLLQTENECLKNDTLSKPKEIVDRFCQTSMNDAIDELAESLPSENRTSTQLVNALTDPTLVEFSSDQLMETDENKCSAEVMISESKDSNCSESKAAKDQDVIDPSKHKCVDELTNEQNGISLNPPKESLLSNVVSITY